MTGRVALRPAPIPIGESIVDEWFHLRKISLKCVTLFIIVYFEYFLVLRVRCLSAHAIVIPKLTPGVSVPEAWLEGLDPSDDLGITIGYAAGARAAATTLKA